MHARGSNPRCDDRQQMAALTMAKITLFDPFGELDEMFKGFMLRLVRLDQQ